MRVFFLGTGAAEGLPALFCDCSICGEARRRGGPNKRTRSTVLIDELIKIDFPPDTLAHVHAYPDICLAHLEHLIFTHSHDDHFSPRELQYLSPNFAPNRRFSLNVYGSPDVTMKILPEMTHFFEKAPLRLHTLTPFKDTMIGHLRVTPLIAHHKSDELCLNFLLADPDTGKTLLYGSDTGWWPTQTWEYLATRCADAVILECGKGKSDNGYDGHLNIDECVQVKQKLESQGTIDRNAEVPFYLTHISHTGNLLHEEMNREVAPYGMTVAHDGLNVTI